MNIPIRRLGIVCLAVAISGMIGMGLGATGLQRGALTSAGFLQGGTGAILRTGESKLRDTVSVCDFESSACPSGNDAAPLQAAIAKGAGAVEMPASPSCYNIGSTTIALTSGLTLRGGGMGGPGQGPTCIIYTGSGCAILLDSTIGASVRDLDIRVNSTNASSAAVCIKSTTGIAEFNSIEGVSVRETNATPRTAGQVGVLLSDSGNHGVYWNTIRRIRGTGWDTTLLMQGNTLQGVNANRIDDVFSAAHNTAVSLIGPNVSDNTFTGTFCSRSDGSLTTSITCISVGDNVNVPVFANHFFGFDGDQGAPSVCAVIGQKSGGTVMYGGCESGGPIQDNNTTLNPSLVYDSVQSTLNLQTIKGAGSLGGTTNLVLKGGAQVGGIDGYVELGTSGQSLKSGVRIASSIETIAKPFAPVDCSGANLNPTVSTVLAGSIFTCATAQTITLPTGQGTSGLVQSLPHVTVGDIFRVKLAENHASNTFTLAAGAGGTIYGIATVTNGARGWECRVTSIAAGSETYTCY